jgi:murein DD-endopeptidase MepM/ murein hydrolase activator NlpD
VDISRPIVVGPESRGKEKKVTDEHSVEPTTESSTADAVGKHLWNEGIGRQVMSLNPSSSLQAAMSNDGYVPTSPEFRTSHQGSQYACQLAENLGTGERRVYYVQVPNWKDVKFVTSAIKAEGAEPGPFKFEVWPTVEKRINQKFGERPDFYKQFGLPGHEGIDLAAPFGTPYMCVAPGKVIKVSDKRWNGQPSAYGWHVVVEHRDGYTTLYAHAKPEISVSEGQEVAAGQVLAMSGNTGNSSGPHLHLTLKKQGYQLPGWGPGYMDPYDLLRPLYETVEPPAGNLVEGYLWSRSFDIRDGQLAVAKLNLNMREKADKNSRLIGVVKAGTTIRILDTELLGGSYMYCEASIEGAVSSGQPKGEKIDLLHYIAGDGRIYEVENEWGSQESFQTQWDGTRFFQTKNQNWEEFFYDNDFIYRDVDTSPGAGRFYRVKDADRNTASRWIRRHMAVGETYAQARRVQFYRIEDCAESAANSGNVTDTIKLVAHHKSFECKTGFKLNDVVELLLVNGGEKYFYAKDYGLVAWERTHDDPNTPGWSGIAEEHARGTRPDNQKLAIGCL